MRGSLARLRALAARILDLRTMERVIDPLLADLQMEYADANRRGCVWKRRWTLIAGHVVFLKTVALCEAEDVMTLFSDWPADDIAALKRTLNVSIVAIALTTVVLEIPPLLNFAFRHIGSKNHPVSLTASARARSSDGFHGWRVL